MLPLAKYTSTVSLSCASFKTPDFFPVVVSNSRSVRLICERLPCIVSVRNQHGELTVFHGASFSALDSFGDVGEFVVAVQRHFQCLDNGEALADADHLLKRGF